jgi:hypothetical protein
MSENTTTPAEDLKPVRAEVYKEETSIMVDIPVAYVMRFNQLLLEFVPFKDQEHFTEVMKNIGEGKIEEPFAYHCQTILAFLTLIETAARSQDKLQWVEYDPATQTKTVVDGPAKQDNVG